MKFRKIKESRKLANEVSGWDLEDEDIDLANSEECGDNLYLVKLWWGSGYMLDCYNAYAFSEEEALNYVVAHIENTHPKWLENTDEYANSFKEEYDEDSDEFQDTFMYVDATEEGASEPHYILLENLAIAKYPKSHNYPKSKEISESALEINSPSEKQQEFSRLMKRMMDAEDATYGSIMQAERMLKYEKNPSLIKALKGFISYTQKAYGKISVAKLKIRDIEVNESSERERTPIWTIELAEIDENGDYETITPMNYSIDYESSDEAYAAAEKLADEYKDDERKLIVSIMSGEYKLPSGDVWGEPDVENEIPTGSDWGKWR